MEHFESWKDLLNPEFYIKLGGFWLILFIIFAETGLFIGFFLPGDSLLFISGIYSSEIIKETFGSTGSNFINTVILSIAVAVAAIIGNFVGYWFGLKSGTSLYKREDSFWFKKKYLYKAHDFYEEHGVLAVVFARFLPIVRTFAPIIAGIVKMERKKFIFYNIIGAIAWSFSMIFAGHYLDVFFRQQFGIDLKSHLEFIVLVIVAITTLPVLIKLFLGTDKKKSPN